MSSGMDIWYQGGDSGHALDLWVMEWSSGPWMEVWAPDTGLDYALKVWAPGWTSGPWYEGLGHGCRSEPRYGCLGIGMEVWSLGGRLSSGGRSGSWAEPQHYEMEV